MVGHARMRESGLTICRFGSKLLALALYERGNQVFSRLEYSDHLGRDSTFEGVANFALDWWRVGKSKGKTVGWGPIGESVG